MDGRVPASGYGDKIAGDSAAAPLDGVARIIEPHDVHAFDPHTALDVDDGVPAEDLDAAPAYPGRQGTAGLGPNIDHCGDRYPRVGEVQRGLIGAVVVGEYHSLRAGRDRVAVPVGRDRGGQHDAGAVVVGEYERALDCAGGQYHLLGANAPQPLTSPIVRRQVVGNALEYGDEIMVVISDRGAPREQAYLLHRRQLIYRRRDPLARGHAIDDLAARQKAAAKLGLLIREDDPGAPAPRLTRRCESGRAATHHEDVTVGIELIVPVRVRPVGRDPKPRGHSE